MTTTVAVEVSMSGPDSEDQLTGDVEVFDAETFARELIQEARGQHEQRVRSEADRRREMAQADAVRREILFVRTPMLEHDRQREAHTALLRQARQALLSVYEGVARRAEWSADECRSVISAMNEFRTASQAVAIFDQLRDKPALHDPDLKYRSYYLLRGALVRQAPRQKPFKMCEVRRLKRRERAEQRRDQITMLQLACGGVEAIVASNKISTAEAIMLLKRVKSGRKAIDARLVGVIDRERHEVLGYGAMKKAAPPKDDGNKKNNKKGRNKGGHQAAALTAGVRGGRKKK